MRIRMMRRRALLSGTATLTAGLLAASTGLAGIAMTCALATPVRGRRAPATAQLTAVRRVREGICSAPVTYRSLARRLSADIKGALRGRAGHHSVTVYDPLAGVYCSLAGDRHFDAASVVKAIILASLLRWHQETRRPLSAREKRLATLMITQSDNSAATALWNEVGLRRMQHFLRLAKMNETELNRWGYWGLSQLTAADQVRLLRLLTRPNPVLSNKSRGYELWLMSRVVPWQRWGTPAGAPRGITVHVKNGWLPDGTGWHINSIGAFTAPKKDYLIAVLTDDNPSEWYGIDTIQAVARRIHRDMRAIRPAVKPPRVVFNPTKEAPVPPLPPARA